MIQQVQAIGAPFNLEHSSCSDIKPKTFEWVLSDVPIKVFIDGAIGPGINYKKRQQEKKIAWVCESRAIFHEWHIQMDLWEQHLAFICDNYDQVYVSDKQWIGKHPNIKFCLAGSNLPWLRIPNEIPQKSKLVSMVASKKTITEGHRFRHRFAEKYKDKLDLFGGAAGSMRIGHNPNAPWDDKASTIIPYMYSVVMENDSYTTYFTEKVTDCFAAGTIPIYWGAPDIGDYFNTDGIIQLTEEFDFSMLTPEFYQSKKDAIMDNYERVKKMETADDMLFRRINEN
jgi:hypothetical protein